MDYSYNYKEMSTPELDVKAKELSKTVRELDSKMYGNQYDIVIKGLNTKQINKLMQELSDERYKTIKERDYVEHILRERKLKSLEQFSGKVLNFGAYTDVHTPQFSAISKGHFAGIKGIAL